MQNFNLTMSVVEFFKRDFTLTLPLASFKTYSFDNLNFIGGAIEIKYNTT